MIALAAAVFAASLLGSVHCAGMCGAFVCFYAGADADRPASRWSHAAYSLGRLTTYLALGTVAGAMGAAVDLGGRAAGVGRLAAIVAGVLITAWGASTLLALAGVRVPRPRLPAAVQRAVGATLHLIAHVAPVRRAYLTGLTTTLIPCGWLYAFLVTAAGTGSAARGAAIMAVFWSGTLPMMVALGVGARRLAGPVRRRIPALSAAALVVIGLLTVAGRMAAPHLTRPHAGMTPIVHDAAR
jgi:sulfite exporter TauE/SafE